MFEKIFEGLKPFLIWKYNDLLFKYDDKYKAILSEIDHIFKNNFFIIEDNVKQYFKKNEKLQQEINNQPENIRKIILNLKNSNFEESIEFYDKMENQFKENPLVNIFCEKYILNDNILMNSYENFKNSVLWFKKVYNEELLGFYSWKEVNISSLELHKKIVINSLKSLLELWDKKIAIMFQNIYKDFISYFIKNPNIDSAKLENLHKSLNTIYDNLRKKENFKIYIFLEDYIEKCFSDMINLIIKK